MNIVIKSLEAKDTSTLEVLKVVTQYGTGIISRNISIFRAHNTPAFLSYLVKAKKPLWYTRTELHLSKGNLLQFVATIDLSNKSDTTPVVYEEWKRN